MTGHPLRTNIHAIFPVPTAMPNHILSLGLPPETLQDLSSNLCAHIHTASSFEELNSLVDSLEVGCIVLNGEQCPRVIENVTQLLGHTPLTTRIVLLCDECQDIDLNKLTAMGIKTVVGAYSTDELVDKLVH